MGKFKKLLKRSGEKLGLILKKEKTTKESVSTENNCIVCFLLQTKKYFSHNNMKAEFCLDTLDSKHQYVVPTIYAEKKEDTYKIVGWKNIPKKSELPKEYLKENCFYAEDYGNQITISMASVSGSHAKPTKYTICLNSVLEKNNLENNITYMQQCTNKLDKIYYKQQNIKIDKETFKI